MVWNDLFVFSCFLLGVLNFELIFRVDDLIDVLGMKYNVFCCIKWKKLILNFYRYYI